MNEYLDIQSAIEALPGPIPDVSPIQRITAPPGMPLVWVANLRGAVNAYGKGCCRSIQGFAVPGFIQAYEWDCDFNNGVGSSETPFFEPEYTDGETAPAEFTEPQPGGQQIPCFGARVPVGTWSSFGEGGMAWPNQYLIEAGSTNSEHNWGGWWAFNMSEVCGYSKYIDRNDVDGRMFIDAAEHWDMVLMAVGFFMGDIYANCIAEPRPRQFRPFFRRYQLRHHRRCD